ncbi:ATP-binding protein [Nonomuraea pusilla]|uniref:Histidine kinase-like ATPase domain-containing protein n=1 Tax=Nonomuraea pusilla TaxID=46177 RepID=A0A1H7TIY7_9ACTN|nr:ATP-binding protein [Nonomuraea pusilla]SEL84780.1 Histidine kinase-like ATPase domain-containing protein [Nonomuraea pusilla]
MGRNTGKDAGQDAGAIRLEVRLPEEMESITRSRQIAREAITGGGYRGRHEDVLLVVSELVTNALRHGAGAPVLRVECDHDRVRVEVRDTGERLPEPREPEPGSGWGLRVVDMLSTGWGVRGDGEGKAVWCELAAHVRPLAPQAG